MMDVVGSRPGAWERIGIGAVAGAMGTAALNAVTYLDMAVRGRPSSQVPAHTVQRIASGIGLRSVADADDEAAGHRREALGALLGTGAGVSVAVIHALFGASRGSTLRNAFVLGGAAMVAGNAGAVATRSTDPRDWSAMDWLSDLVPHLCYGLAAAWTSAVMSSPGMR